MAKYFLDVLQSRLYTYDKTAVFAMMLLFAHNVELALLDASGLYTRDYRTGKTIKLVKTHLPVFTLAEKAAKITKRPLKTYKFSYFFFHLNTLCLSQ
ncbi:MAG TPA: hypothetical protein DCR24_01190 [Bacillus bacterium]|nr:hypothetical protein [Bacillus sp. (in: firmicutes)]